MARSVMLAAGMACVAAGAAIGFHIAGFLYGSAVNGANLIRQAREPATASRPCSRTRAGGSPARRGSAVPGILSIPSLGLTAPVEDGVSDAVLNDAVGHLPASVWPGQRGTSVLAAHNVTWFSRIDQLTAGATVRYVTACLTAAYRVTAHRIVPAGHPVYNTAAPSLVLVTCYPPNALYPASARYLVFATLIRTWSPAGSGNRPAGIPPLTVPAPHALVAQGLDLRHNQAPLGVLRITGTPAPAWQQSNGPALAERAALAAYFGAIRSASQQEPAWWARLAPAVAVRAAAGLWGGEIAGYGGPLDITLRMQGSRVLGAALKATVTTAGPRAGTYRLAVAETAQGRTLLITGFRMRLAGP